MSETVIADLSQLRSVRAALKRRLAAAMVDLQNMRTGNIRKCFATVITINIKLIAYIQC